MPADRDCGRHLAGYPPAMSLTFASCPRCGSELDPGFVNAGKGPFRWDADAPSTTIFGGDLLLDKPRFWGRQRTPALRCLSCQLVLFEYDPAATRRLFTPTR